MPFGTRDIEGDVAPIRLPARARIGRAIQVLFTRRRGEFASGERYGEHAHAKQQNAPGRSPSACRKPRDRRRPLITAVSSAAGQKAIQRPARLRSRFPRNRRFRNHTGGIRP